jgi:hypothetical protein
MLNIPIILCKKSIVIKLFAAMNYLQYSIELDTYFYCLKNVDNKILIRYGSLTNKRLLLSYCKF